MKQNNRRPQMLKNILLTIIFCISYLLISCSNPPPDSTTVKTVVTATEKQPSALVKIAVIYDQSASVTWTGIPALSLDDFILPVDLIKTTGGEIAVFLIRENSQRGGLRLNVDSPPVKPTEPDKTGNSFKVLDKLDLYKQELKKYDETYGKWNAKTTEKISQFYANLKTLLNMPANARRSDIATAIIRADCFLAEGESTNNNYGVVVSDGIDNVKKTLRLPTSKAKWFAINSNDEIGILKGLNPARYESVNAAFQRIAHEATKKAGRQS